MDAAFDSAKTSRAAANLAQSQQKSIVAGAAGAAPDASRPAAGQSREVAPPTANAIGAFAPTRLESALLATPGAACYAIRPLLGDTTTWLRALPERFALDNAGDGRSERAGGGGDDRVSSSAGRVDSVVQGSSWQQTGPGRVTVVLDAQRTIELHMAANPMTAEANSGGVTRAIAVAPASCPR
jgi:hypothetical protein